MSYVHAPVHYGNIGGTVSYQDPYRAQKRFGPKNDVYSFGVVLLDTFPYCTAEPEPGTQVALDRIHSLIAWCLASWPERPSSVQLMNELEAIAQLASIEM